MPSPSCSKSKSLLLQASHLQVQAANLQTQAADLQTQSAQLQTQQVKLQNQQQSAQSQQKQAKQLQSELTDELTQAGGDPRGTDTRLVNLQNALGGTEGVKVVSPPRINKPGNAATFNVIATTAPAAPATADLVRTLRKVHDPAVDPGHECDGVRRGPDGELRRPRQRDLVPALPGDRSRDRARASASCWPRSGRSSSPRRPRSRTSCR